MIVTPSIAGAINKLVSTVLTKIGRTEYQALISAIVITILEGAGVLGLDVEALLGLWGGVGLYAGARSFEHSTPQGGRTDTDA